MKRKTNIKELTTESGVTKLRWEPNDTQNDLQQVDYYVEEDDVTLHFTQKGMALEIVERGAETLGLSPATRFGPMNIDDMAIQFNRGDIVDSRLFDALLHELGMSPPDTRMFNEGMQRLASEKSPSVGR